MLQNKPAQLENAEYQRIQNKLKEVGVITQQEYELFLKVKQQQEQKQTLPQYQNIQKPPQLSQPNIHISQPYQPQIQSQKNFNLHTQLVSSIVENQPIVHTSQNDYHKKIIEELKLQIQQRDNELQSIRNQNTNLQQKALSLDVVKSNLISKENNLTNFQTQCQIQEQQIKTLQAEIQRVQNQSNNYQKKLNDVLSQMPQNFRFDSQNDQVYSQREWELMQEKKNIEDKMIKLQKEKDKIYLENYELKKLNNIEFKNLDETNLELDDMAYQNNLQISEFKIRQLERKLQYKNEENIIIQEELNLLRNLDGNNNEQLDNEYLANKIYKLEKEKKVYDNIQENLEIESPEELKKIIFYLQQENKKLKGNNSFNNFNTSNNVSGQFNVDNNNNINNLLNKIQKLEAENKHLNNQVDILNDNSLMQSDPHTNKRILILQQEKQNLQKNLQAKQQRLQELENDLLVKNMKLQEVQNKKRMSTQEEQPKQKKGFFKNLFN